MRNLGMCGLIAWIIGIAVGIWAMVAVTEMTFWLPALLIGVALAAFIGLVLGGLVCGMVTGHDAGHGAAHAGHDAAHHPHAAVGIEALAEAEAGALEAGAREAGIDPAEAAREKEMLDARINAERAEAARADARADESGADESGADESGAGENGAGENGAEIEAAAEASAEAKVEAVEPDAPAAASEDARKKAPAAAATTGTGSALADEMLAEAEAGDRDAGVDALSATESTPDYDGDGVKEGTGEGTKPATMSGPRDGGADNLKEIKGVGPKLEAMLHDMGFYHFDQIAAWGADEVAWVDANLKGFKGRVSRDNWVEQAKILAEGGETEFSKRVDKGQVY